MATACNATYEWLSNGQQAFASMLGDIASARESIRLETYIYSKDGIGSQVLQALIAACRRGVRVWVLVDAWGAVELPDAFWNPLRAAGGKFEWFNPLTLPKIAFRDHRKLLVCDERIAYVGGFNIAPEYAGDGVQSGWCDHGLRLTGPLADELAAEFDVMFERADFKHPLFTRLRKSQARKKVFCPEGQLLFCGPGRGRNPFKKALTADFHNASEIRIVTAYFLPTWKLRRELARAARRGVRVQLLLPGKTDVAVSQLAARSLYRRLLRAGVEVYEYQPQVLHAKLAIVDDAVYVGSANLDARSLHINYELMVRLTEHGAVAAARALFEEDLRHSRKVQLQEWRKSRSFWTKLRERWAYFLLARVDPYLTRRLLRNLGA
jgi:cardiolipin synthase